MTWTAILFSPYTVQPFTGTNVVYSAAKTAATSNSIYFNSFTIKLSKSKLNPKQKAKAYATYTLKSNALSHKLIKNKKVILNFKSTNPKVATINSKGEITALKKGTTYITVSSLDKTSKILLTVSDTSTKNNSQKTAQVQIPTKDQNNVQNQNQNQTQGNTQTQNQPQNSYENDTNSSTSDWRDQILYFIMTDRFADGDTSNDDQGYGEYGHVESKYNGGDLQGISDKLDYIKGLGVTSIWITPPVANQWWCGSGSSGYGGYHGYWASNFKEVDKHLGTLDTYKSMVKKYHDNNMSVVQDIVANHMGNYFTYTSYDPNNPTKGWTVNDTSVPTKAPTQPPFDQNNPNLYLKDAIYHFTPSITNWSSQSEIENYQLSDLDDLNTENPTVRNVLKDSYRYWIKEVGVDGFRIDTARHVPKDFWQDFLFSNDSQNEGIKNYANSIGKKDFFTFGEVFDGSNSYVGSYTGTKNSPLMDSCVDYPMYFTLNNLFKGGSPTSIFRDEINQRTSANYQNPDELVTFIDNHDNDRWLVNGNTDNLKEALTAMMTIPGVPCIYYGTEQDFTAQRGCMFKDGYASNGVDHYDTNSEMYKFTRTLCDMRKSNKVFSRGALTVLNDNSSGPGVLAYKMSYNGENALVLFNTSNTPTIINNLSTGLKANSKLKLLVSTDSNINNDYALDKSGNLSLALNGEKAVVFLSDDSIGTVPSSDASITVDNAPLSQITSNSTFSGKSKGISSLYAIIDGRVKKQLPVTINDSNWSLNANLMNLTVGSHTLTLKGITTTGLTLFSVPLSFTVNSNIGISPITMDLTDQQLDDRGPLNKYLYPNDASYTKQLDILDMKMNETTSSLDLTFKMSDVTRSWGPQFGFDHVSFCIFLDDPNKIGASIMPGQNSSVPSSMNWDYEFFCDGWRELLSSSDGAGMYNFGNAINSNVTVSGDINNKTITMSIPKDAINADSLKNWKIYVTTWDYDGPNNCLRIMQPAGGPFIFGGGSQTDPYIMDDLGPVTLN